MKSILIVACVLMAAVKAFCQEVRKGTIDRKTVVQRHNFHITDVAEPGPTQVGNGNFAYGLDVTGMQTFNDRFATMSQWGWHSTPPPAGFKAEDFKKTELEVCGRLRPYDLPNPAQPALTQWFAANPHKFNLGRIGLWLKNGDGSAATKRDIRHADQYFDLWTAVAVSSFEVDGQAVRVTTVADPDQDAVAFRIESPLIAAGRIGVFIDFPYASLDIFSNGSDYSKPALHRTVLIKRGKKQVSFHRMMDSTRYTVEASWSGNDTIVMERPHRYRFVPSGSGVIEYVFRFSPAKMSTPPRSFAAIKSRSERYWPAFWNSGGFMDLSGSSDPRWMELERRIVLSQYIMKINASGKYPPQETGLVNNSWYGRFHYEMILWNQAHFALWDRWSLVDSSLRVYPDNLEKARKRAALQGYNGARYPKCTGPDGREWPHPIHAFLVWQQPTPIFFADLDYRAHPSKATLRRWLPVTDASADFLASYVYFDTASRRYVLGPPATFVSENNDYYKDKDPAFELGYWRYALRTAARLRQEAGLPGKPSWEKVYSLLAPLPVKDGAYEQWEGIDSMWTKFNFEHPALLGAYGLLPGDGVDTAIMRETLRRVMAAWKFDTGWGWDFPLMAMTAARLGEAGQAIDLLLHPSIKNRYDRHGFVGVADPYPYIPGNGGLLYAVALMAAGWDGDGNRPEPGFLKKGAWVVKWEGLKKAI